MKQHDTAPHDLVVCARWRRDTISHPLGNDENETHHWMRPVVNNIQINQMIH